MSNDTEHAKILSLCNNLVEVADYLTPSLDFNIKYSTSISSRQNWSENAILENSALEIYIDGSKTEDGVETGMFSAPLDMKQSFRLPDYCSVIQAEVKSIREAAEWLSMRSVSSYESTRITINKIQIGKTMSRIPE